MLTYQEIESELINRYSLEDKSIKIERGSWPEESFQKIESTLGIKLAEDYKEFYRMFRYFQYDGTYDILLPDGTTNVDIQGSIIFRNEFERKAHKNFPKRKYLIYDTLSEGLVYLQDSKGNVYEYESFYPGKPELKYSSLLEFVNSRFEKYKIFLTL